VNETARVLLTPAEYLAAQSSKRAMPNEKTWQGAYRKSEGAFRRLMDKGEGRQTREMVSQAMPNLPLLGSFAVTLGAILCPFTAGVFEYLITIGLLLIMQGGRQMGMEAHPELWVSGAVTLACMAVLEMGGGPSKKAVDAAKVRTKPRN
jgi:hypothetical protein